MSTFEETIAAAFEELGKAQPGDADLCIYRSGLLDSAELMQLFLEIELETGQRLDLSTIVEGDVTINRLKNALSTSK